MNNVLVYDSEIAGHHAEYIEHLVKYICNNNFHEEYYFLVNPEFLNRYGNIVAFTKETSNIHWLYLSKDEYKKVSCKNLILRSFKNYSLLKEYAKRVNAMKVMIMHINNFQPAFCIFSPKYSVSGILFLQFYRQPQNTLKDKIRYYRKYFTTKLFTKNKSLKSVFVLNDEKSVNYLNREFHTNIFKTLTDPIPALEPIENFDVYKEYAIEKSRKIFLHIGLLDDRKGTLEIFDAIPCLEKKYHSKICLIFAGQSDPILNIKIQEKIEFYSKDTDIQLIRIDDFISNELMKSLFDQCFCVLLPYKMPEASSGIFGHAVAVGKTVIGNSQGLLGEMIDGYELGITLEYIGGRSIANAISKALTIEFKSIVNKPLNNSPEKFAKAVLKK